MAKVEIKSDKCITSVLLNGTDISKTLSGVDLRLEAGRLPEMILHSAPVPALKSVLNDVSVKSSPELLQIAAEILRTEFMQKGDWYTALVESIAQYLRTIPANKGLYSVAEGLADRIVGIGPDHDSIDNLDLTIRTYVCLNRAGIKTVSQLRQTSAEDLMKIKNFTQQSLDELAEKLEKYELLERGSS